MFSGVMLSLQVQWMLRLKIFYAIIESGDVAFNSSEIVLRNWGMRRELASEICLNPTPPMFVCGKCIQDRFEIPKSSNVGQVGDTGNSAGMGRRKGDENGTGEIAQGQEPSNREVEQIGQAGKADNEWE